MNFEYNNEVRFWVGPTLIIITSCIISIINYKKDFENASEEQKKLIRKATLIIYISMFLATGLCFLNFRAAEKDANEHKFQELENLNRFTQANSQLKKLQSSSDTTNQSLNTLRSANDTLKQRNKNLSHQVNILTSNESHQSFLIGTQTQLIRHQDTTIHNQSLEITHLKNEIIKLKNGVDKLTFTNDLTPYFFLYLEGNEVAAKFFNDTKQPAKDFNFVVENLTEFQKGCKVVPPNNEENKNGTINAKCRKKWTLQGEFTSFYPKERKDIDIQKIYKRRNIGKFISILHYNSKTYVDLTIYKLVRKTEIVQTSIVLELNSNQTACINTYPFKNYREFFVDSKWETEFPDYFYLQPSLQLR